MPTSPQSASPSSSRSSVERFIDRASGAGLLALFGIAGAASFSHIHDLAAAHGETGWRAWALPVCIDVLAVMAGFEILRDSRAGRFGTQATLPWLLLVAGVVASVAANVAQAEPTLTGRLIAAAPALAFVAGSKLVVRRLAHAAQAADRAADRAAAAETENAAEVASESVPASEPVPETVDTRDAKPTPVPSPTPVASRETAPATPEPEPSSGTDVPAPSPQLVAFARRLAHEHEATHGRPLTAEALRTRLRVSHDVATSLLAHLHATPEPTT